MNKILNMKKSFDFIRLYLKDKATDLKRNISLNSDMKSLILKSDSISDDNKLRYLNYLIYFDGEYFSLTTYDRDLFSVMKKYPLLLEILSKYPSGFVNIKDNFDGTLICTNSLKLTKTDIRASRFFTQMLKKYAIGENLCYETLLKRHSKDIENFSKDLTNKVNNLNFIISDDIASAYNRENLFNTGGTLHKSCMNNKNSYYYNFYKDYGAKVLLLVDQSNIIHARALLWDAKTDNGVIKFMDKVYYDQDKYYTLFQKWAKDNEYYIKEYNDSKKPEKVISPSGEKLILKMWIENTTNHIGKYFPYLDTFKFSNDCRSFHNTLSDSVALTENNVIIHTTPYYDINNEVINMTLSIGINGTGLYYILYRNDRELYLDSIFKTYELSTDNEGFYYYYNNSRNKVYIK